MCPLLAQSPNTYTLSGVLWLHLAQRGDNFRRTQLPLDCIRGTRFSLRKGIVQSADLASPSVHPGPHSGQQLRRGLVAADPQARGANPFPPIQQGMEVTARKCPCHLPRYQDEKGHLWEPS